MDLMTEKIIINSVEDIDNAINAIIESKKEYFNIVVGDIEPTLFKFQGGRFDNEFIPIETLKIARVYRTSFKKYFKAATGKEPSDDMLYFNTKRGSFELDFQSLFETFITQAAGKMTGTELTVSIVVLIGAWAAKGAYSEYLNNKKELAEIKAREASDEASKENAKLISKVIDDLINNNALKNAKNRPPKAAIEMLDNEELFVYGTTTDSEEYTQNDIDAFSCDNDHKTVYETIEDTFAVKAVKDAGDHIEVTLKNKTLKTFTAVSKLDDNMPLYSALDNQKEITLKVNIGKDENGEIVEADIYEA